MRIPERLVGRRFYLALDDHTADGQGLLTLFSAIRIASTADRRDEYVKIVEIDGDYRREYDLSGHRLAGQSDLQILNSDGTAAAVTFPNAYQTSTSTEIVYMETPSVQPVPVVWEEMSDNEYQEQMEDVSLRHATTHTPMWYYKYAEDIFWSFEQDPVSLSSPGDEECEPDIPEIEKILEGQVFRVCCHGKIVKNSIREG